MELRFDSRITKQEIDQARALLLDRHVVMAFGDQLTLSALAITEPIQPRWWGPPPRKTKLLS